MATTEVKRTISITPTEEFFSAYLAHARLQTDANRNGFGVDTDPHSIVLEYTKHVMAETITWTDTVTGKRGGGGPRNSRPDWAHDWTPLQWTRYTTTKTRLIGKAINQLVINNDLDPVKIAAATKEADVQARKDALIAPKQRKAAAAA